MEPNLASVLVIVEKLLALAEAQGADIKTILDLIKNPRPAPATGLGVDPGKPTG